MKTMEFWFEFASTYSYPAAMRVEAAARAVGVTVQWKAFLLGPIFKAQGYESSPFVAFPVKGRYMWRDIERLSAKYGLDWRQPTRFPRTSVTAARIACSYGDAAWLPAFVRAIYHANFAQDRDIGDDAVVRDCLIALGLDADAVLAHVTSAAEKPRLREQGEQAAQRGLFGAPSFVVDGELFWGNDRLEDALDYAQR
ncbi:2-hydroxychromene-2-carboxylate isomerase [Solimonas terrae]|uniref:2-hydroxychromene-2-carboxylate isomerase n=1 Tax=Solimonas terrae TaxID=1396819 RepID=A0A6M2BSN0_9GAMM|nr:2-hydroxychromene-2-carboxylate isomerase [Solimonas terrae]NGY05330.1 2-hydroxychromene-2-carboxylate isomerase [Solimonas terrae]